MTDHIDTLAEAFRCLTDEELGNMLFHREKGTQVLCGNDADHFVLDGGG